jgi:hypothetical protein
MKTQDLISALAADAGPAQRAPAARRLAPALAIGLAASTLLAVLVLGGWRGWPVTGAALGVKWSYAGALVVAACGLTARLARPAMATRAAALRVGAVLAVMVMVGAGVLLAAPPEQRMTTLLGQSWQQCPWVLMGVSLPALAATLWAVKGLAPTRPRAAGAAAGLLAGAVSALGYALACHENSPAFVATWYTAGISLTTALGAALGPRVLRW